MNLKTAAIAATITLLSACAAAPEKSERPTPAANSTAIFAYADGRHADEPFHARTQKFECRNHMVLSVTYLSPSRLALRQTKEPEDAAAAFTIDSLKADELTATTSNGLFGQPGVWLQRYNESLFTFTDPDSNNGKPQQTMCRAN